MKILFVVQRYGEDVGGGAEQHCRWLAEGLAERGHDITVISSRAHDYMTWANHYREGTDFLNGVKIHRFGVRRARNVESFNRLSLSIDFLGGSHPLDLEDKWLESQGPDVVGMSEWLDQHAGSFDVVVPFTYLYRTSQVVIEVCSGRVPIWMHATAHDEPPFHLRRIREYLQRVDGFLCSTPEEASLLHSAVSRTIPTEVVGVGVSLARPAPLETTLVKYEVPRYPYVLILGRVDESKGVLEGIEFFREFKRQCRASIRLIVVGQNVARLDSDSEVSLTGFVEPDELSALLMAAEFLIQPSYFESFSLALCEAWLAGTPTLANGNCAPVAGQTERSRGGLLYRNQREFIDHALRLHNNPRLRRNLSKAGRTFVRNTFESGVVLARIEAVLQQVTTAK